MRQAVLRDRQKSHGRCRLLMYFLDDKSMISDDAAHKAVSLLELALLQSIRRECEVRGLTFES